MHTPLCTTLIHNTTQLKTVLIIFPLSPQMNIMAQMLSLGGEGHISQQITDTTAMMKNISLSELASHTSS